MARMKKLGQIKDRVVADIKWLAKKGEPLNISAVKRNHPALLKTAFAVVPFWGWKKAIEDAGLDYGELRVEYKRTVTCRVCNRELGMLYLHLREHGLTAEQYGLKYPGAPMLSEKGQVAGFRTRHGNRAMAIPHWEFIWTREYVLDRLHVIYGCDSKNVEFVRRSKEENPLVKAACDFFGSFPAALEAAGIPRGRAFSKGPAMPRTADAVVTFIRGRVAQGLPINYGALVKDGCSAVWFAAREVFGSYATALKAVGFDPKNVGKKWRPGVYPTQESVLAAIEKRRLLGKPLNHAGVARGKQKDLALWNRGRRLFGSWPKALEKAGIDPESVSIWRYRSPESVIQAIRRRFADTAIRTTAKAVRKGPHAEPTLYDGALRHFGGWPEAVKAAGVRYEVRAKHASLIHGKEALIAAIRRRHAAGLPMSSHAVIRGAHRDGVIASAYRRHFKGWHEALCAAGMGKLIGTFHDRQPYPTREAAITGMRARLAKGLSLSSTVLFDGPSPDRALYTACRKFFGPYKAAIRAMNEECRASEKNDPGRVRSVSSAEELMRSFGIV